MIELRIKDDRQRMPRFVSPPIVDLDRLRQPLTPGERIVFDFFHAHLDHEWEIYLQPHLNGLRPDFVLLHPKVGIAVFEVKDWDLDAMDYWISGRDGKRPALMARRNGKTFKIQSQNPVDKVLLYKKELHDIYCPRLAARAGFAAVTAGIIFPFAKDEQVVDLLKPSLDFHRMSSYPQYYPVSGAVALQSGDLARVLPESARKFSQVMSEDLAKDVRNWLVEPDSAASQRRPLELDDNQQSLIKSRTASGYRRIKGPAGSGKSLVLAARAAELLGDGKEVLVVTFNITLLHYLMDVSVRWRSDVGRTRSDVTWLNFHYWCKRVCEITDHTEEYDELWRPHGSEVGNPNSSDRRRIRETLTRDLPNLVGRIIEEDDEDLVPKYDAVLVDEGQDFLPGWWNLLRKVCKPDGEMLLVADATQDVYETARSWTDDAMKGAGFRGGWSELKLSYRLPPQALNLARSFAERFRRLSRYMSRPSIFMLRVLVVQFRVQEPG